MTSALMRTVLAALSSVALGTGAARAVDLRFMCYQDGNECEVMNDLLGRFTEQNPGIRVLVDTVPYRAILESLPAQLATRQGPDMARITDYGGLSRYYLDLSPYVNRGYRWRELARQHRWS